MQFTDYLFQYHKRGDHGIAYEISDKDEDSTTRYYGYLSCDGSWIIMEWDTDADTFRYAGGSELYPAAWAGRAALSYGYYNALQIA